MSGSDDLVDGIRLIVVQDSTITGLRLSLFMLGVLTAVLWSRRRPMIALSVALIGAFVGLAYWLVQITTPFGITTDPGLAGGWAQAGVNALAESSRSGFVLETEAETSLVSVLASLGLPFRLLILIPQAAVLTAPVLLALAPFAFLRSRTNAALAGALAVAGGLWPGITPYGSILSRPSVLLAAVACVGILLVFSRQRTARREWRRFRLAASLGAVGVATLNRVWSGGLELPALSAVLLAAAAIVLAPLLRATIRASSRTARDARRHEAIALLCVFGGSGLLWWDPPKSVPGFREACNPNSALQGAPMEWIRNNVPKDKVVLASPVYSAAISAFTGRRVLFASAATEAQGRAALAEQPRREHLFDSAHFGQPVAKMAESFSVTHFFLGPGEPSPPDDPVVSPGDEPPMKLVLLYRDLEDFRIYRLDKK